MAATGALFGVTVLAGCVLGYASARSGVPGALRQPALAWAWLTQSLALAWVLFLLWFPDGNFLSVRWKRFVLIGAVASLAVAVVGYLLSSPGGRLPGLFPVARAPANTGGPLATPTSLVYLSDVLSLALPFVALAALAQRFRHSGAVVRQQVKWFVAAAAAAVIGSSARSSRSESIAITESPLLWVRDEHLGRDAWARVVPRGTVRSALGVGAIEESVELLGRRLDSGSLQWAKLSGKQSGGVVSRALALQDRGRSPRVRPSAMSSDAD